MACKEKAFLIERVDVFALALVKKPNCVLVDEAQFVAKKHVEILAKVVDILNIPVICYGLKGDFRNCLFEGSQSLLACADKIQEIKTVCYFCDRKATMNMRLIDGKPVFEGDQKMIEKSSVTYLPVCRCCYMNHKNKEGGHRLDGERCCS